MRYLLLLLLLAGCVSVPSGEGTPYTMSHVRNMGQGFHLLMLTERDVKQGYGVWHEGEIAVVAYVMPQCDRVEFGGTTNAPLSLETDAYILCKVIFNKEIFDQTGKWPIQKGGVRPR